MPRKTAGTSEAPAPAAQDAAQGATPAAAPPPGPFVQNPGDVLSEEALQAQLSEATALAAQEQPETEAEAPQGETSEAPTAPAAPPAPSNPDLTTLLQDEQVSEYIYREVQSRADRLMHEYQRRLELERQAQEQAVRAKAERERLEQMTDEERGQYLWQQRQEQERMQRAQYAAQVQANQQIMQAALGRVSDPGAQQTLLNYLRQNAYPTVNDFLWACAQTESNIQAALKAQQQAQINAQAQQREQVVQQAQTEAPTLGTGQPARKSLRQMTTDELLAEGWAEEIARKRKRGG